MEVQREKYIYCKHCKWKVLRFHRGRYQGHKLKHHVIDNHFEEFMRENQIEFTERNDILQYEDELNDYEEERDKV